MSAFNLRAQFQALQLRFSNTAPTAQGAQLGLDKQLLGVVLCLMVFGWVMVYSMSIAVHESKMYAHQSPQHYVFRQMQYSLLGLVALGVALRVPLQWLSRYAGLLLLLGIALCAMVFIPFFTGQMHGAKRWLVLYKFNLQPSECLKLAMIVYFASFCARKRDVIAKWSEGLVPIVMVLGVTGLILLMQPDIGAFVVVSALAFAIYFYAGGNLLALIGAGTLAGGAIVAMTLLFRQGRLSVMAGDVANRTTDQIDYALAGMAKGGVFGEGLGAGIEKLHWLKEVHTDFILAGIGEELGFMGVAGVLLALGFIIYKAFGIARRALERDLFFHAYAAFGIGIWLTIQTVIHASSNLKLLPPKGLTLPFVSYGGTAQLIMLAAVGLLLRIDLETKQSTATPQTARGYL